MSLLILGLAIYLPLHFTTGDVAAISDDHEEVAFIEPMAGVYDCLGLETFGMFRPVKNLIFYAAEFWFGSLNAFQWIGAAVAVMATGLTWLFLRRLFVSDLWAALGSLIWLYLPLNVVIFNWGSALNIGFYYIFSLACILAIDRSLDSTVRGRRGFYFAAGLLFYFCNLMSYEMALSLPLLLALYITVFKRDTISLRYACSLFAGLILFTVIFLYIRNILLDARGDIDGNIYILPAENWQLSIASSVSFFEHMRLLFNPFAGFEMFIPFDPANRIFEAVVGWIAIGAITIAALFRFKKNPLLLFGLMWSALALGTILNVIPVRAGPIAEYYMSLASLGMIILVLSLLIKISARLGARGEVAVIFLVAGLLVASAIEVYKRQPLWRSDYDLVSTIAMRTDRVFTAHKSLALIYQERGDFKAAFKSIERAMEMSNTPDIVAIWLWLLINESQMPESRLEALIEQAITEQPHASVLYDLKGDFLLKIGEVDSAKEAYLMAEKLASTRKSKQSALTGLGIANDRLGNLHDSVEYFRQVTEMAPNDDSAQMNLKIALEELSKVDGSQ